MTDGKEVNFEDVGGRRVEFSKILGFGPTILL
jgi:hypothetical protein